MNLTLSPETQQLLVQHLARHGYATADQFVRDAVHEQQADADADPETLAAIDEGMAQAERGEGRPLAEVRDELRRQFGIADL